MSGEIRSSRRRIRPTKLHCSKKTTAENRVMCFMAADPRQAVSTGAAGPVRGRPPADEHAKVLWLATSRGYSMLASLVTASPEIGCRTDTEATFVPHLHLY